MSPARRALSASAVAEPSSRSERGERAREAILKAAMTLFAERGFHAVSLDDVAAKSDSSRPLILYHYRSKIELWRFSASHSAQKFNDRVQGNLAKLDGGEDRLEYVGAWLDAFIDEPAFARLMVLEGGEQGERLDWLVQHTNGAMIPSATPTYKMHLDTTVLRDALMAIFLAMAALGPLMEATLSRVSGQSQCGVYPLSSSRRHELLQLIAAIIEAFEGQRDENAV